MSSLEIRDLWGGYGDVTVLKGVSLSVQPGQAVYIPPHALQFIENTGPVDLEFLCIVDPPWRQEDEEVL